MKWHNEHFAGIIPLMLSEHDPRPMREQLHTGYAHGGGVQPFKGFAELIDHDNPMNSELYYPGDPPTKAVAFARLRDELFILFAHSWAAVVSPGEETIITRMD
jgi:hypothetical protein